MRLLFIAYHFPPTGGAGTQRSSRFVRFLPEEGVVPIVLAGPGPDGGRWEPEDGSLLDFIPSDVTIVRAQPTVGKRDGSGGSWERQVRQLGRQIASNADLDCILVTLGPYDGMKPAIALGREFGIPVIADLRDPWALDEVRKYRTRWHRARDRRRMGDELAMAALTIANTPDAASAIVEAFPLLDPERVVVVPNGFVAEDFPPVEGSSDSVFRITHTGYLHTDLAIANARHRWAKDMLGGGLWNTDVGTRSHVYLLRAVEQLCSVDPLLASRIEVVLSGVLSEADRDVIESSGVSSHVVTTGYLSHREAIEQMMRADVLFLPLHNVPTGRRTRSTPGKTYEYLASGKPIIAAVPEGYTKDLIENLEAGVTVGPADVGGIARAIQKIERNGLARLGSGRECLQGFEARNQTALLAEHIRATVRQSYDQ